MSEFQKDRIQLAEYELEVRRSPNRKTVEITIERSGQVVVRAPDDVDLERISEITAQKKVWILERLAEKEILLKSFKPKEFVSGETFYFLGRPYRLKIAENPEQKADMWIDDGRIFIKKAVLDEGIKIFKTFCRDMGQLWLSERVEKLIPRIGVRPTRLSIRDLGFRWGSCSENGTINFHWKVMTLPPKMIDYIIAHELMHLIDKSHSELFWRKIQRVMPDYLERKQWLAENGAEYAG